MPFTDLPACRERSAPSFDDKEPEALEWYFSDLETLFVRHTITSDLERKQAALRYLSVRTESLWETTATWEDQSKSFSDFKVEVFAFYPGASGDRTYRIRDLDILIGHYAHIGIQSATELGDYHRHFLLISRYLIGKGRLSAQEQSRSFFRGLQPSLEVQVRQRLQQKFIDHFLDDPYKLTAIYEAVSYVLMCAAPAAPAQLRQAPNPPTSTSTSDPTAASIDALTSA
jgi:hypothetical protein